jgi:NAD-dependent DNA ligase
VQRAEKLTVALTGRFLGLSMQRGIDAGKAEVTQLIASAGGRVKGHVSGKTWCVVVGVLPGRTKVRSHVGAHCVCECVRACVRACARARARCGVFGCRSGA